MSDPSTRQAADLPSAEFQEWAGSNSDVLQRRLCALFLRKIFQSHALRSEVWDEVRKVMKDTSAPDVVQKEAKKIAAAEERHKKHEDTLEGDRLAAADIIQHFQTENFQEGTPNTHVQQAMSTGKLSRETGERVIKAMQNSQAVGEPPGKGVRWGWGRCAFCGALGMEFGPIGVGLGCIFCGFMP